MGLECAWCNSVLRGVAGTPNPVSHVLCMGCLEELRVALASGRKAATAPHGAGAPSGSHVTNANAMNSA